MPNGWISDVLFDGRDISAIITDKVLRLVLFIPAYFGCMGLIRDVFKKIPFECRADLSQKNSAFSNSQLSIFKKTKRRTWHSNKKLHQYYPSYPPAGEWAFVNNDYSLMTQNDLLWPPRISYPSYFGCEANWAIIFIYLVSSIIIRCRPLWGLLSIWPTAEIIGKKN